MNFYELLQRLEETGYIPTAKSLPKMGYRSISGGWMSQQSDYEEIKQKGLIPNWDFKQDVEIMQSSDPEGLSGNQNIDIDKLHTFFSDNEEDVQKYGGSGRGFLVRFSPPPDSLEARGYWVTSQIVSPSDIQISIDDPWDDDPWRPIRETAWTSEGIKSVYDKAG
jgi:hypothetical protein